MRQYRLVVYIRVNPEDQEPMTYEQALAEKEQEELLFPENICKIEEIEDEQKNGPNGAGSTERAKATNQ